MDGDTYLQIQATVKKLLEIDLSFYKEQQMKRRLDTWLIRSSFSDWPGYLANLRTNTTERARFRDFLTINVSAFFRDPDRWQSVRQDVMPRLLRETFGRGQAGEMRLWSAGCSIGAEAYTLAIILAEVARGRKYYLLASDLDRGVLGKARAGGPYTQEEIKNITATQKEAHFNPGGPPFFIRPALSHRITFREHNLLADVYEKDFDFIVCRNVLIYFNAETKNELFVKFHAALRPGGVLFLGGSEIMPFPQQIGFRSFGPSFYEKV